MGADDDVDLAIGQAGQCLGDFLGGAEARQLGDFYRPVGKTVGKSLEMLLGEQGSGNQYRDLAAIHQRHKCGA